MAPSPFTFFVWCVLLFGLLFATDPACELGGRLEPPARAEGVHRVHERRAVRTASAAQLALALEPVCVLQPCQRQVSTFLLSPHPYGLCPSYRETLWVLHVVVEVVLHCGVPGKLVTCHDQRNQSCTPCISRCNNCHHSIAIREDQLFATTCQP